MDKTTNAQAQHKLNCETYIINGEYRSSQTTYKVSNFNGSNQLQLIHKDFVESFIVTITNSQTLKEKVIEYKRINGRFQKNMPEEFKMLFNSMLLK